MHSVELLQEALEVAHAIGIEVRQEWLGEAVGGICRIGPKWILFVDLSLPVDEQVKQALLGLNQSELLSETYKISSDLRKALAATDK